MTKSETLYLSIICKNQASICFLSKSDQKVCSSMSHSSKMDGNESIVVCQSSEEIDEVLDVGAAGSIGLTFFLGSITATGLIIKGIFVYYIKCAAPKERPINNMILYDQVSKYHSQAVSQS